MSSSSELETFRRLTRALASWLASMLATLHPFSVSKNVSSAYVSVDIPRKSESVTATAWRYNLLMSMRGWAHLDLERGKGTAPWSKDDRARFVHDLCEGMEEAWRRDELKGTTLDLQVFTPDEEYGGAAPSEKRKADRQRAVHKLVQWCCAFSAGVELQMGSRLVGRDKEVVRACREGALPVYFYMDGLKLNARVDLCSVLKNMLMREKRLEGVLVRELTDPKTSASVPALDRDTARLVMDFVIGRRTGGGPTS